MATLKELEEQIERVDNQGFKTHEMLGALEHAFMILWRIQPEPIRDSVVQQLLIARDQLLASQVEEVSINAFEGLIRRLDAGLTVPKKPLG